MQSTAWFKSMRPDISTNVWKPLPDSCEAPTALSLCGTDVPWRSFYLQSIHVLRRYRIAKEREYSAKGRIQNLIWLVCLFVCFHQFCISRALVAPAWSFSTSGRQLRPRLATVPTEHAWSVQKLTQMHPGNCGAPNSEHWSILKNTTESTKEYNILTSQLLYCCCLFGCCIPVSLLAIERIEILNRRSVIRDEQENTVLSSESLKRNANSSFSSMGIELSLKSNTLKIH